MQNAQSSAQAMQSQLEKHWTDGGAGKNLSELNQMQKNGRLASIKFGTTSIDYTSEAKSKFIDQPNRDKYSNDSQKYKIKFQTSNIPNDPNANRAFTMQTVAMVTENLKGD